jgi:hypothetical protein
MGRKECTVISYRTSNARKNLAACFMCFAILGGMRLTGQVVAGGSQIASRPSHSSPPEGRSPVILAAINDPHTGKTAFSFNGREDPPVIRAALGEDIQLACVNAMSKGSHEKCIDGRCMNMTNLHFHGREKASKRTASPKVRADAWLLAVAQASEGILVTFDKALASQGANWLLPKRGVSSPFASGRT